MEIRLAKTDGIAVLTLAGRLTLGHGDELLRARFRELLAAGERRFVFDLSALAAMDSAGVGEIVACAKRAYERGAIIKVALDPEGRPGKIFALTHLDRMFEIFGDEAAARRSYAP